MFEGILLVFSSTQSQASIHSPTNISFLRPRHVFDHLLVEIREYALQSPVIPLAIRGQPLCQDGLRGLLYNDLMLSDSHSLPFCDLRTRLSRRGILEVRPLAATLSLWCRRACTRPSI